MAGTINLSMTQQFDSEGIPLSGGKLYFFQAGTTNPQSAYQDASLTILWPNPIELDASGRIPQFYLADGSIKLRLADRNGVTVFAADNVLVIGASAGDGNTVSVDATTILQTGDIKVRYGTGTVSGFVRANGRTIGSASSGASELQSATAQALFEYLWNTDSTLTVSTGRGASSAADWAADKTITLPDARGRVIAFMDDMGNTSAGRLDIMPSTTLGGVGGFKTQLLSTTNLPAISYTPTGTVDLGFTDAGHAHSIADPGHTHTITDPGHAHGVYDPGHNHTLHDPGHYHTTTIGFLGGNNVTIGGGGLQVHSSNTTSGNTTYNSSAVSTGVSIDSTGTGISINGAATGVHNISNYTGVGVAGSSANLSFSPTFTGASASFGGSSTPFGVCQPTIIMTVYIKL